MQLTTLPAQKNNLVISIINALVILALLITNIASPVAIVLGYFFETIIIGILNVVKMILVIGNRKNSNDKEPLALQLMLIPFVMFHYGCFIYVQSVFVFLFFSKSGMGIERFPSINNFIHAFRIEGIPEVVLVLAIPNVIYFFTDFIKKKSYLNLPVMVLMFQPYTRIVIQQLVVIISGFFILVKNTGWIAAVLLIIIKLLVDIRVIKVLPGDDQLLEKYREQQKNRPSW